jgi:hypothetical protein
LVRRPLIGLFYQPQLIDDDECGAVGGKRIGSANRGTRRKLVPMPLCPPQIPHVLPGLEAVGSRRLPARAMVRPLIKKLRVVKLLKIHKGHHRSGPLDIVMRK